MSDQQLEFEIPIEFLQPKKGKIYLIDLNTLPANADLKRRVAHNDPLIDAMARGGQPDPICLGETELGTEVVDGRKRIIIARQLGWTHIEATIKPMSHQQAVMLSAQLNNLRSGNDLTDIEAVKNLLDAYPSTENARTIAHHTGIHVGRVKQLMKLCKLDKTLVEACAVGLITEETLEKIAKTHGAEEDALEKINARAQEYARNENGQWLSGKTGKILSKPPTLYTVDDAKAISKVTRANAVSGLNLNLNLNVSPKVQGYMVIDPTQVFPDIDQAKEYRLLAGSGIIVLVREV